MNAELAELIEEQRSDDTTLQRPQANVSSIHGLEDHIFTDEDGEPTLIHTPPRGTVLVQPASGTEPWHGTIGGYNNYKCKCDRCRAAFREYRRRKRGESK